MGLVRKPDASSISIWMTLVMAFFARDCEHSGARVEAHRRVFTGFAVVASKGKQAANLPRVAALAGP